MAGGRQRNKATLVTISQYAGEVGTGAWEDLSADIANCGCDNLIQIKRALDSIAKRDWQVLTEAMKSLKPTELGLHHIEA